VLAQNAHTSIVPHEKTKLDEESRVLEWQDEGWFPHLMRMPAEQRPHTEKEISRTL